jgi:transcriptional regulator with XRE-family HTH domain
MEFGNRLKLLREEKGVNRERIAILLNITYSSIAKYETNERFPDKESLVKLSKYFNVSIDYLLGLTDIKEPLEEIIKKGEVSIKPPSDIEKLYESLPAEEKKQFKDFGEYLKAKSEMDDNQREDCATLDTIGAKKKNVN